MAACQPFRPSRSRRGLDGLRTATTATGTLPSDVAQNTRSGSRRLPVSTPDRFPPPAQPPLPAFSRPGSTGRPPREAAFAQFGRDGGQTGGTFKATLQHLLTSDDGSVVGVDHSSGERDGKHLDVGCCIVFEVKDGRITDGREHFMISTPGTRSLGCQHGWVTEPSEVVAETERVVIRPWHRDEADRLFDLLRREEVVKWIGGTPMKHRDEAVARIDRYAPMLTAEPRFGAWAAVERSSGVPAGSVVLKPLPDGDGEVEIGWHLHPDSWGRGLAREGAGAVPARGL